MAFRNEMIHETRIIPLDGRPTPPAHVKSYMGESRGHFEGNTLVVRTTNLNGSTGMQGNGMMLMPSDALELVERFTPVERRRAAVRGDRQRSEDVDAALEGVVPAASANPDYQIFEYACHEGNNAMRNILSGSRADEARRRRSKSACLASRAGGCCGQAGRRRPWPRRRSRPGGSPARAGQAQGPAPRPRRPSADVTGRLARYMVAARDRELPPQVVLDAKHRILDTVAAMVSGARLPPGQAAIRYVRSQGGTPRHRSWPPRMRTTAVNAALANGMFAHADETDDFEPVTKAHPGSAVVPAALAMAERERRSGTELLRAVTLGYDVCCRFLMALGPDHVRATHRSAEGTSATFGAVARGGVAGAARRARHALRPVLCRAAGVRPLELDRATRTTSRRRSTSPGMGARNGVTAATMVQSGFTGVAEVLDGEHNMLIALSTQPRPEEMVAGLGTRFFVSETAIKVFSVGYPIQSPLDALLTLRREHGLTPDTVTRLVVRLPRRRASASSDGNAMPDVNLQHLMAVALIDGTVSFEMSHSRERMADPQVLAVKARVQLEGDRALVDPAAPRSGAVEATLKDGRVVRHFTRHPPGTKENPLRLAQVADKARALMAPVLGERAANTVISRVNAIEGERDLRDLARLMRGGA